MSIGLSRNQRLSRDAPRDQHISQSTHVTWPELQFSTLRFHFSFLHAKVLPSSAQPKTARFTSSLLRPAGRGRYLFHRGRHSFDRASPFPQVFSHIKEKPSHAAIKSLAAWRSHLYHKLAWSRRSLKPPARFAFPSQTSAILIKDPLHRLSRSLQEPSSPVLDESARNRSSLTRSRLDDLKLATLRSTSPIWLTPPPMSNLI